MMYDEDMIAPMRQELTTLGIAEARTPDVVEQVLNQKGTTLVVVNSVCGCAAAQARPGVAEALSKVTRKPDNAITVFAGNDRSSAMRWSSGRAAPRRDGIGVSTSDGSRAPPRPSVKASTSCRRCASSSLLVWA